MPTFTVTVDDVKSREVRTRDGRESKVFQIYDDKGHRWETWKKQLANEAYRLIGQPAVITGRIEENGEYTNYRLDDIQAANGATYDAPYPDRQPAERARAAQPQEQRREWQPDGKDLNIERQVAIKVSAWLVGPNGNPNDFWANLNDLMGYMSYGTIPNEYGGAKEQPRQQQQERFIPEEFDPGPMDRPEPDDSDIPFDL